ncbi:MAG: hypothetical protein IKB73_03940 [Ruminococcus sp.]|nr:hypothetical protein [Ruminococcus sp.]
MRNFNRTISRALAVVMCALFIVSLSFATPKVEAASESPITETKENETDTYTSNEDAIALARAKAMDEAKLEAVNIVEELQIEKAKETEAATVAASEPEQVVYEEPSVQQSTETSSSSSTSSTTQSSSSSSGGSYVSGSTGGNYLMDIDNPDPNYTSYAINLSPADRDLAERIVMGEAGHTGYTGMALVAQTLRDNFVRGGYSDIATVISTHGYYGSTSITPTQECKDVINFIFDQGGAAVQHRVLVFYASNYCSSSWHESQQFVCQYGYQRFFDCW